MPQGSRLALPHRVLAAGFWLLVAAVFLFPYSGPAHRWCDPFSFPAATIALLVLFRWRWRKGTLARVGIPRSGRDGIAVLALLAVMYLVSGWLVAKTVAAGGQLVLVPFDPATRTGFLFQALNEEVLLGFLPLMALERRFGRPAAAALGLAALFALLHVALYRLGSLQTWIRWETFAALLAVGVLRNALILLARHIGFAWALHAGWNLTMLAGNWRQGAEGPLLSEPAVFDRFLGHPVVAGIAGAAALGSLAFLVIRRTPTQAPPTAPPGSPGPGPGAG
jgi:hypothetical protein